MLDIVNLCIYLFRLLFLRFVSLTLHTADQTSAFYSHMIAIIIIINIINIASVDF